MALSHGLHKSLLGDNLTDKFSTRCRDLWWTVYILDRTFSSLMGVPASDRDEDKIALSQSYDYKHSREAIAAYC